MSLQAGEGHADERVCGPPAEDQEFGALGWRRSSGGGRAGQSSPRLRVGAQPDRVAHGLVATAGNGR